MKSYIFSFLLVLGFAFAAQAQSFDAQKATKELTKIYNLSKDQQVEILNIQERKADQLASIASLKETDSKQYVAKLKSIRYGTFSSIERVLNNQQLEIFRERQQEFRKKEAMFAKNLKAKGADKGQMEEALIKLYE